MNVKGTPDFQNYPTDVGKLIFTKCSTPGCHNDASKDAAGGLSMQSWDKLFEGGRNSACVIPYRSDYSTLCYFSNTYSDLGLSLSPTMPFNKPTLTHDEESLLKNWIDAGAPSSTGAIKFADNPNRKKFYVTNQNCDVVTVFDAATLLPMRYINIGNSPSIEYPHNIKVSPDGKYWYVVSTAGNSLQKYRTSDDGFVGEAFINSSSPFVNGNWNTVTISNDGNFAYVVDWENLGDISIVNTNTLAPGTPNLGAFANPHGSCMNPTDPTGDTLYVTENYTGSYKIYKIYCNAPDLSSYTEVPLSPIPVDLNTHEVLFSPDGSEYFVTCQGAIPEVKVLKTGTDQLLATIPVGALPSEMSVSATHNLLFVSCEEDTLTFPGKTGSVYVIDISTNSWASTPYIYTGHQPHGLAVDDNTGLVYVANRNKSIGGPAPHHSGECGGKDGYMTFIDMKTLTLLQANGSPKTVEVAVDPYSVAVRH